MDILKQIEEFSQWVYDSRNYPPMPIIVGQKQYEYLKKLGYIIEGEQE